MPKYEDNGKERWTFVVYVIELDAEACADRRSDCDGTCDKTPVYVGETAHGAEHRFAQHRDGDGSSRWVRNYGLRLRPDLAGSHGEVDSREASKAAEAEQAEALRQTGLYCVYGGH